jgi:hypothetical protein
MAENICGVYFMETLTRLMLISFGHLTATLYLPSLAWSCVYSHHIIVFLHPHNLPFHCEFSCAPSNDIIGKTSFYKFCIQIECICFEWSYVSDKVPTAWTASHNPGPCKHISLPFHASVCELRVQMLSCRISCNPVSGTRIQRMRAAAKIQQCYAY